MVPDASGPGQSSCSRLSERSNQLKVEAADGGSFKHRSPLLVSGRC
jgi:hypothetical protein